MIYPVTPQKSGAFTVLFCVIRLNYKKCFFTTQFGKGPMSGTERENGDGEGNVANSLKLQMSLAAQLAVIFVWRLRLSVENIDDRVHFNTIQSDTESGQNTLNRKFSSG